MRYVTLPALNSKKEPNIIEITNAKIVEGGQKFTIPAERFEFAEYDTIQEFVQECGGEDAARAIINEFKKADAVNAGKNKIRTATSGTEEEIIAAGLAATRSHSFAAAERITAAEAKEKLTNLKEIVAAGNLSEADLAAAVKKMLGL